MISRSRESGSQTMGDGQAPILRLFAYGTLKRGFWNYDRYCGSAQSVEESTIQGRLYELPSGIPALEVPRAGILRIGTSDLTSDIALADRSFTQRRALGAEPWQQIQGELITLGRSADALAMLDRLECFDPDGDSLYIRALVSATCADGRIVPAWCYIASPQILRDAVPTGRWKWP